MTREIKILFRFTLLITILTAAFWFVFWLIKGSVPTYGQIPLYNIFTQKVIYTIHLPFALSRLWDILAVPLWVLFLFCCFVGYIWFSDGPDKGTKAFISVFQLFAGLILGSLSLFLGLFGGFLIILGIGLVFAVFYIFGECDYVGDIFDGLPDATIMGFSSDIAGVVGFCLAAGFTHGFAAMFALCILTVLALALLCACLCLIYFIISFALYGCGCAIVCSADFMRFVAKLIGLVHFKRWLFACENGCSNG